MSSFYTRTHTLALQQQETRSLHPPSPPKQFVDIFKGQKTIKCENFFRYFLLSRKMYKLSTTTTTTTANEAAAVAGEEQGFNKTTINMNLGKIFLLF